MAGGFLFQRRKRRLYLAYDHFRDGEAFATFSRHFSSRFRLFRDNSLHREIGTRDAEAHIRWLAKGPLAKCEAVLVLCGEATHLSAFVDWEISAALDRGMGLIGVGLPSNPGDGNGRPLLPERLQRNFDGGYASLYAFGDLIEGRVDLGSRVAFARGHSPDLIDNALPLLPSA